MTEFTAHEGLGVSGLVGGRAAVAGRRGWLEREWSMTVPAGLVEAAGRAESLGRTPVWVGWDGAARGVAVVADTVKDTSAEAVAALRGLGLTPVLLTGDNSRAAKAVAAQVGITEVIAEVMPADKVAVVRSLQEGGKVVAMVGDGVNDAAALAQVDLGLAMGTGSDVAIEASDLTLVRGDLRSAADAIRLSRRALATIKGNLFWAFLQRGRGATGGARAAQPAHRRRGDGLQLGVRGDQQPAAAPLPADRRRLTRDRRPGYPPNGGCPGAFGACTGGFRGSHNGPVPSTSGRRQGGSHPVKKTARTTTRALIATGLAAGLVVGTQVGPVAAAAPPAPNPNLAVSCGLDVVLAIDASYSIKSSDHTLVQMKQTMNNLVKAFADKNTRVGIVTFNIAADREVPLT